MKEINKTYSTEQLKQDFLEMQQNYEFLESQINKTILNNIKPTKMQQIKTILKKANEILKECAKGANYAINN